VSENNRLLLWAVLLVISVTAVADHQAGWPVGSVRIQEGVTVVIINDRNESITLHGQDESVDLTAGTYRIDSWTMDRFGRDGSAWELKGTDLGKKGVFEVANGGGIKLSIGEPIISSLSVRKEGSTYCVTHSFGGQLSETVEITRNGSRPDAPKLEIRNADGSYQETLTFGYG
jgi:hypothetical protein